jgi:hypothetical protein
MDDLVKRLRNPKGDSGSDFNATYWVGLITEAADRIEKLEREKASWKGAYDGAVLALTERNKELEAALREIADGPRDADKSYAELFVEVCMEARAALGEKKDD